MNLLMVGNIINYKGTDWEIESFKAGNHTTFATLKNQDKGVVVPVEELEFNE